jgi:haloacid dehalogenase-like hydrolase
MNIFFDVDETLIAYDGSLRPGARSVFERLVSDGHRVYVWSGRGIRTSDVHRTGLGDLVSGIYQKPLSDFKAGLARCGIPALPDFVIDDYPGIVEFFGGLCIRPYHGGAQADNELSDIPDLVRGLGSARVRLQETAAPLDDAPRSRPQGTATSWPCRCSHGRCTIYWRLRETGLRCPALRPGSGAQRCVRAGHDRGCARRRPRARAHAYGPQHAPWNDTGTARAALPRSRAGSSRRTRPAAPARAR